MVVLEKFGSSLIFNYFLSSMNWVLLLNMMELLGFAVINMGFEIVIYIILVLWILFNVLPCYRFLTAFCVFFYVEGDMWQQVPRVLGPQRR